MTESEVDFRARLQRTLGAPDGAQPALRKPAPPLPAWYLRRDERAREARETAPEGGVEKCRGLPRDLGCESNARGEFSVRVRRFPREHAHGRQALGEVLGARGGPLAALTGDAALAEFDPCRAVFLDIETTGLSGGAGTHVFLVGLLAFDEDGFELWQGFQRSPADAPALLEACAARVAAGSSLVTFFGKSFDRHRLEDQMRMHGVEPPFAGRAHLDLYHPCRRLYADAFADARLATMERELCGVERVRDLPGSQAPAAWFDFLAGREHALEDVFRHNELDVLSLAGLCAHASKVLDEPEGEASLPGAPDVRAKSLARMFAMRRDWPAVLTWSERALARASGDREALAYRARARQRMDRAQEALADFEQLAAAGEDGLAAEAWGEVALLRARAGAHRAAADAVGSAEELAARTLCGTRAARLARSLQRARSLASRPRRSSGAVPP